MIYHKRVIDDYLPRKNKDQLYHAKKLDGEDDIKACSTKFLIERRVVDPASKAPHFEERIEEERDRREKIGM